MDWQPTAELGDGESCALVPEGMVPAGPSRKDESTISVTGESLVPLKSSCRMQTWCLNAADAPREQSRCGNVCTSV